MPRVDIWDVQAAQQQPAVDCGFGRDLEAHYEWGAVLGKGGFGLVRCEGQGCLHARPEMLTGRPAAPAAALPPPLAAQLAATAALPRSAGL